MTSVQENKNELEAAVRYCESAISRAKATIESMEFRQQAASKAWHEQTGREAALEREVTRLKGIIAEGNNVIDESRESRAALEHAVNDLKLKNEELKTNMALMTDELEELRGIIDRMGDDSTGDSVTIKQLRETLVEREEKWAEAQSEIAKLNGEVEELGKAYNASYHEEVTMKKAWREQRELVALKDDQIAMLERRLAKKENPYPFQEGDTYYVFNGLDGTWIESVWDDESERLHDSPRIEARNHQVYFSVDQKKVLDQFNPDA